MPTVTLRGCGWPLSSSTRTVRSSPRRLGPSATDGTISTPLACFSSTETWAVMSMRSVPSGFSTSNSAL
ncbi:hypothetical protein G6F46_015839 [Rhizopus delemar]|nr:hypothetical protein G6F24_017580 [Rhizopus arrhizus]KAG1385245.1 hypothetical protein G6F58_013931 [Rhizopus delemar]KAG1577415.1 hypothetical protein G6F46_015839 [Rhizopus delemar]KAG1605937.1 hypothetical protein G6F45_014096 [Rhizopus arrhizus]